MVILKSKESIWELGGLIVIEFLLKKILKKLLHQQFKRVCTRNPLPMRCTEGFKFVSSLSDKGECVVELSIPIPKFYPFFSGSLEPHQFILVQHCVQIILKFPLKFQEISCP